MFWVYLRISNANVSDGRDEVMFQLKSFTHQHSISHHDINLLHVHEFLWRFRYVTLYCAARCWGQSILHLHKNIRRVHFLEASRIVSLALTERRACVMAGGRQAFRLVVSRGSVSHVHAQTGGISLGIPCLMYRPQEDQGEDQSKTGSVKYWSRQPTLWLSYCWLCATFKSTNLVLGAMTGEIQPAYSIPL